MVSHKTRDLLVPELRKVPTGISGFDEITGGGLPRGRPTLVCGTAGCGKTMFGMEFLVHGALDYGDPGVFMSFEERTTDLAENVASLGFALPVMQRRKQLLVDHVRIERNEIEETGAYDLEGLFIRIGYAVDSIGAKRIVLDTIESLFAGLSNAAILRSELRRLFHWLKERGLSAVVTGERGTEQLTRQGLEEYVSDCVILLDHRVENQISTRRLRIVKYRGASHGSDEYPFLIDRHGLSVAPITSLGLDHAVSTKRISSGIERLDAMLGGKGYYRGSTILISGAAGTGKTSFAAHFVDGACRRRERCLWFVFEESPQQVTRNMRSIGIDLDRCVTARGLEFHAVRPTYFGLETHLTAMHRAVAAFKPTVVIIDPITNLVAAGSAVDVKRMLLRLIDYLKSVGITTLCTSLTSEADVQTSDLGVSSLMDTWLLLTTLQVDGERQRGVTVLKARGLASSNRVHAFRLTNHGVELRDSALAPTTNEGQYEGQRTRTRRREAKEQHARKSGA